MKKISLVCMLFLITFSACCTSSKKAPEKPPLVTRLTTYLKDNALSIVLGVVLVVGFYVWAKDRTDTRKSLFLENFLEGFLEGSEEDFDQLGKEFDLDITRVTVNCYSCYIHMFYQSSELPFLHF